jgi:D-tyrosyl-tRNA(Tyr) deacylase
MRAVVQRVSHCSVTVDGQITGKINTGLLVLLGVSPNDSQKDLDYIVDKVLNMRIFSDENDKMNLSVQDIKGDIMAVSQFTLYGDVRKGRRPSFSTSAPAEIAKDWYDKFACTLRKVYTDANIATGIFQSDMKVELLNDGPVTILLDSEKLF